MKIKTLQCTLLHKSLISFTFTFYLLNIVFHIRNFLKLVNTETDTHELHLIAYFLDFVTAL